MHSFKDKYSFETRLNESTRVQKKYPNSILIIIESSSFVLPKQKFLIPKDMNIQQLIYIIRKKVYVKPNESLFLFCNNKIPPISQNISEFANNNKDEDGFLYMIIEKENVFGSNKTEAQLVRERFPNKYPLLINSNNIKLPKNKYIVPDDMTVGQFVFYLRKSLSVDHEISIFLYINGKLPPISQTIQSLYNENYSDDGFLRIDIEKENTFG